MTKTKQKEIREAIIKKENEGFGLDTGVAGLYHHVSITGHAFTVEITVPAHAVDFANVVDFAQWLALFSSDESIRNMTKQRVKKMLENSDKEGDIDDV